MKYGYARVSTDDQNADLQHTALKKARAAKIYTDDGLSGATTKRPALLRCLKAVPTSNMRNLLPNELTRQAIAGVVTAFGGMALGSTKVWAGTEDGISHTSDANQFDKIIQLSGVMRACTCPTSPRRSAAKREASSSSSMGISRHDTWNLCRTK